MEPLTEQRKVSGPIVYGFLRLAGHSPARQQALTATVIEYCRTHELTLAGLFTERCASTAAAFTGLLQALQVPGSYGAVLPAPSHLGPKKIALERMRRLDATGARLLLVRGTRQGPRAGLQPERGPVLEAES